MNNTTQSLIKCAISSVISVFFQYLCSISIFCPIVNKIFGSVNLPSMVIGVLIFFIVLFLLRSVYLKLSKIAAYLIFIAAAGFIMISFFLEKTVVFYSYYQRIEGESAWLIAAEIILCVCFLILTIRTKLFSQLIVSRKRTPVTNIVLLFVSVVLISLSAYNQYRINFLHNNDYKNLHAYTNTIFNLFWGQPFTETITSVYGHYAFFYYPLMKLIYAFGYHNLLKIYLGLSVVQIVCTLVIWIVILWKNVKNPLILGFGIFFICFFTTANCTPIYHQLFPHRTFPLAIGGLLIFFWYKAERKEIITAIGYLAGVLLIIWNSEIGIVILTAWSALHICSVLQTKNKKSYLLIAIHLAAIPLTFMISVLFCGILNRSFGGEMISVKDFLFPILSPSYMKDLLEHSLQSFPSAWMSITVLLLSFLGYGVMNTVLFTNKCQKSDQTAVCFSLSVLALGALTYAINRPAYNSFFIIMPVAGLMLSIIADSFSNDLHYFSTNKKNVSADSHLRSCCACLSLSVLFIMTISSFANIPYKIRNSAPYKDTGKIVDFLQYFDSVKDNKAIVIGDPFTFFYAYLGVDPDFYYMDMTDLVVDRKFPEGIIDSSRFYTDRYAVTNTDVRYYYLSEEFLSAHHITPLKMNDLKFYYFTPIE